MASKEKREGDGNSKEANSGSPFGHCQAMFEKMRGCCGHMGGVFDCCSMVGKMKDEKRGKLNGK